MNRPRLSKKIEPVIKNLPTTKKSPGLGRFTGEFYQTIKEELTPFLLKQFPQIKEASLSNSFYEAALTWHQRETETVREDTDRQAL